MEAWHTFTKAKCHGTYDPKNIAVEQLIEFFSSVGIPRFAHGEWMRSLFAVDEASVVEEPFVFAVGAVSESDEECLDGSFDGSEGGDEEAGEEKQGESVKKALTQETKAIVVGENEEDAKARKVLKQFLDAGRAGERFPSGPSGRNGSMKTRQRYTIRKWTR